MKRIPLIAALLLSMGCMVPMPPVPATNNMACVDHCQARYESCVSHTATRWGFGAFAFGAVSANRNATSDCRNNLSACYGMCPARWS
jgi:hypothetical protein